MRDRDREPSRSWRGARSLIASGLAVVLAVGCECGRSDVMPDASGRFDTGPTDAPVELPDVMFTDAPRPDTPPTDAPAIISPDAACGVATVPVDIERLPVDIIWMVDNSASMAPAIAEVQSGMNAFADTLVTSGLDYRLILLSLRGMGTISFMGTNRYAVCIPEPLAGAGCADGPRFFQVEVDVRSTMPLEQFLGTLAQTNGYEDGSTYGGGYYASPPWRSLLRDGATKTIVVVTDDNQRTCDGTPTSMCPSLNPTTDFPFPVTALEDFPGGGNPFNGRTLGPGILDAATYGTLFDGYVFDAVYGYDPADPSAACAFPGGGMASSAGPTYTALVSRTGGVRASLCDGASAWGPFFDAVATGVVASSRIACDVVLPPPPDGMTLDPTRVNVSVFNQVSGSSTFLPYVGSMASCDPTRGGWYYDVPGAPTQVSLCPASCDFARAETSGGGRLDVLFGCESILF